jgi:hypothetical protein
MKKNLLSSIFVFTLILVGLFLLAGCQLEADVAAAAGSENHGPQNLETTISSELWAFDRYLAEHPVAAKAGIVYAVDPVDLKLFNAADAAPATVSAGKSGVVYAMDPVNLKLFNAAFATPTTVTADQARWDARGEFYTSHIGARSAEAINADQARWDARGELYTSHTGARSVAAINADQARWDALGELYTS